MEFEKREGCCLKLRILKIFKRKLQPTGSMRNLILDTLPEGFQLKCLNECESLQVIDDYIRYIFKRF